MTQPGLLPARHALRLQKQRAHAQAISADAAVVVDGARDEDLGPLAGAFTMSLPLSSPSRTTS